MKFQKDFLQQSWAGEPSEFSGTASSGSRTEAEDFEKMLYIHQERFFEKHGFTAGCPACGGDQIGRRSTGVHHNDMCQDRIEDCA